MSNYLNGRRGVVLISAGPVPTSAEKDNNIIVPKQDGLKVTKETIAAENSGRSIDGVMHINWIKNDLRKLEITMPPCQMIDIRRINNLCIGKECYATFIDPFTYAETTRHVYNSGASLDTYSGVVFGALVHNFSFSLIDKGE